MKMQFVFGNPIKGSSVKHKNSVTFNNRSPSMAKKVGSKMNALRKSISKKMKSSNPLKGKEKKIFEKEGKKFFRKKLKAQKAAELKKREKEAEVGEDLMVEMLDASVKKKKNKGGKMAKKKKVAKKIAKKATKKKAIKKATKKKAAKKVAKKATKKKVHKAKSHKKKSHKRKAHKAKSHKRKSHKRKAHKAKSHKRKAHKKKATYRKLRRAITKKKFLGMRKKKAKRFYVKGKGKRAKKHKGLLMRLNPIGGNMASKFETFTGHSLPEAGGLALGGVLYGATNSILAKIPVVNKLHAQLVKVPVVGSALPTLLAGAVLNYFGEKKKINALSMIGKGLVGASVVGIGVSLSQKIPGLSGVDFTMSGEEDFGEAQLGYGEGEDFGEMIEYNTQALSGVDYTMNGVDYTMNGEEDFGELPDMNQEMLSGQLG